MSTRIQETKSLIKFRLAALISALLLTSPVLAGEIARTIEWEDLVPKMEPLEDPFKTLTTDQLTDLQTLLLDPRYSTAEFEFCGRRYVKGRG